MTRTRIAPSPTGFPHIGTVYQALFDKLVALGSGGKFILRIEDTDRNRYVEGAEDAILDALAWFGLSPDEGVEIGGDFGPYRQSERLDLYQKYAKELVDNGHAYYCFCSKARLDDVRGKQQAEGKSPMYDKHCRNLSMDEAKSRVMAGESYVIRMKVPEGEKIVVHDLIRGDIEFVSDLVDDQVILKADGYPTYHLAVVVDDHLMKISHVIRGPEWITSFPKHKLLYDFFGWDMPVFAHTPMISNMDGSKLSKRHGHSSVDWYRRKGFLAEAVINFIALLGWSHPEEKELFDFNELVKTFRLEDMSAVSPKFDLQKLEWMNGQYIQKMDDQALSVRIVGWLLYCKSEGYKGAGEFETSWSAEDYTAMEAFLSGLNQDKLDLFARINKERMKRFEDLLPLNEFFIKHVSLKIDLLTSQRSSDEIRKHLEWLLGIFPESELQWTLENLKVIEQKMLEQAKILGWKTGEVFYPIRVAVTASKIAPPLFESMYILCREKTIERIVAAINSL